MYSSLRVVCCSCLVLALCSGLPFHPDSSSPGKVRLLVKSAGRQSVIDKITGSSKLQNRVDTEDERRKLTSDLMQNDNFAPDGKIDYDALELPKPERLIPDAKNDTLTDTELEFMQMHERAQFMRIAEIKESILSKLRLLAPPNITAMKLNNNLPRFPDHILPQSLDKLAMQSDESSTPGDEYHAKISTIIQFAVDGKAFLPLLHMHYLCDLFQSSLYLLLQCQMEKM